LTAKPAVTAGAMMAVSAILILMGIVTAEALYPAPYATDVNTISDLGGTRPPEGIVRQPSATIFDITMILAGMLILASAFLLRHTEWPRRAFVPLALLGAGVLGVGVFPGNTTPHPFFALTAFAAGGSSGLLWARVLTSPARQLSAALGAVSLVSLLLGLFLIEAEPVASLGEGGIERWVAYPVVLWLILTGGYLSTGPQRSG
jgi:hypothetical membrane protein